MKKKVQWALWGTAAIALVFAGMSAVQGEDESFLRIGQQIIVGQDGDEGGPVRKPIVNRETIAKLDLTTDQFRQIELIEKTLFEKYPEYKETLTRLAEMETQLDEAKDRIEGWGRIKKEYEESLFPVLTQEQLALMHPGKGEGPKGKVKIHLDRLSLIELSAEQQIQIERILDQFESEQTGVKEILKMEMELKPLIKAIEKSIETVEEEYANLVLGVLTEKQVKKLPLTGPPEHAGPPPHAKNKR